MAASTATQEEFLRLLDENAEFRQQVRQRILSQELIELPERFAVFASRVDEFITEQRAINAEQREFNAEQRAFNAEQRAFNAEQRAFNAEQRETNAEQRAFNAEQRAFNAEQRETNARVEKRLQGIADDIGMLKGNVAVRATRDNAERIVEQVLDLHPLSILSRSELVAMLRPKASEIERTWRHSFYRADLVMQCEADDGTVHYMAAEASYTADRRDTDRALRNAGLLTRCTNAPAHAIVASVRNDHEVQALVDAGKVHWFQLTNRDLTPD
ncbi:MAG: hypothetical protein F4Y80_08925 [Caldilineaceae bacterium SB0665_bin_21]|nr:hypothetical protein [Caldilineaceae bacterium SB0665_bin_21]